MTTTLHSGFFDRALSLPLLVAPLHLHTSGATPCWISAGFTWLRNQPLTFINCNGQEERSTLSATAGGGTSYLNNAEAQAAVDAVQQLLNCATSQLQDQDIGVITPYSGQVWQHAALHVLSRLLA